MAFLNFFARNSRLDWINSKDPLNVPKAVRLRDRAGVLKSRADARLREADALLAEAQVLEDAAQNRKRAEEPPAA
jgi:hypothetical protein